MEPTQSEHSGMRMDRRETLEWLVRVSALVSMGGAGSFGQQASVPPSGVSPARASVGLKSGAMGYGPDPSMVRIYNAGELWSLTLDELQRRTVRALCDVIVPGDSESPAASEVGVVEFLDEWVSAPYPEQQSDRPLVLEGLGWVNGESRRWFGKDFADLDEASREKVCESFADPVKAKVVDARAARFFRRLRDLAMGGYYTTPQGMKAAGYVGNVPVPTFEGPPEAALRHVGLA